MTIDTNFQTDPTVCEYMAGMLPKRIRTVLEPTPGVGNLVASLLKRNFVVTAAEDFFLLDKTQRYDAIVMNPPFSSKSAYLENAPKEMIDSGIKIGYSILLECMEMSDYVIALMPWFTLSDSDVRMRTLKKYGMKSITPLPRKTFQYARIQTVVIELIKGYQGETAFKTIFF